MSLVGLVAGNTRPLQLAEILSWRKRTPCISQQARDCFLKTRCFARQRAKGLRLVWHHRRVSCLPVAANVLLLLSCRCQVRRGTVAQWQSFSFIHRWSQTQSLACPGRAWIDSLPQNPGGLQLPLKNLCLCRHRLHRSTPGFRLMMGV